MPDLEIIVLARNRGAYYAWCEEQGVRRWGAGYRFAAGPHVFDDRTFAGIVIVDADEFWKRTDADDLYRMALAARAEF